MPAIDSTTRAAQADVAVLSFDEFCDHETEWNELVADSDSPVPFLTHPWIRVWWSHFGERQEFRALVLRDGSKLLAGVALALRTDRILGRSFTVGEIVGTGPVATRGMGLADKADLLVRRGAPEARPRLVAALFERFRDVHLLTVKGCDESSPTVEAMASGAPGSCHRLDRSMSPFLPLPPTWDEYLRSRSGNFRKHLKKYRRILSEKGSVEISRLGTEGDARAWMKEAIGVSRESWTADRGTNLFRAPALEAFFSELAVEMASRGWLDLHILRIDGTAIAYEMCFDFGGRIFSYNGSFRKDFLRASPGTVLTAAVIESACSRGRREYDMLRGTEEYKSRWSTLVRRERQIFVTARGMSSRMYGFARHYLKERMREQSWLRDLADRIRGSISRRRFPG